MHAGCIYFTRKSIWLPRLLSFQHNKQPTNNTANGTNQMDAQPSTPPIPPTPPTPPQTPPRISFIPPLYLQRRTAVHSILRNLSSSPRFAGALRSLLDVGCGVDCLLLRSLIPCEDELPVERLTGIDIDADIWSPWCRESISPGSFGGTGAKEDRWRGLDVSLLHGGYLYQP